MLSDGFFKKLQMLVGIATILFGIFYLVANIITLFLGNLGINLSYGEIVLLFLILYMVLRIYNTRNN